MRDTTRDSFWWVPTPPRLEGTGVVTPKRGVCRGRGRSHFRNFVSVRLRASVVWMSALPSGTVTLLFTDVEGSTRLLQELGRGYEAALVEHHRIVRRELDGHVDARSTRRGRRSSPPSRVRATRSRPPWMSSGRSGRTRSAFGSACILASRALPRRATWVSTFRAPPASVPPATAVRCCSRRPLAELDR